MTDIGIGLVGCGNISSIYLQNIPRYRGLSLRACADTRPEAAAAQAGRFGIAALSVDELLARDDIDLVVNLTPPNAHFGISLAALRAGKHVFSEKPLAVDFEEGRRLVDEAERHGLLLGCAPDTFLGAGGRLARRLVDQGAVGTILSGTAFLMSHGMEHWHPDPEAFFKPGGGPILDMAPYYLNALVNLIGPVRRVFALSGTGFAERVITADSPRRGERIKVETPTTVMALLEFASGAQVTFCMSWDVWRHGHPAIELYGTDGSLRVPDPNFFGGAVELTERSGDWQTIDSSNLPLGAPNWRAPH
jgi:predicted dehydrogenase